MRPLGRQTSGGLAVRMDYCKEASASSGGLAVRMDYCKEASASIELVRQKVSQGRMQLHPRQCQYLSTMMSDTKRLLTEKASSLDCFNGDDDVRRKALRQLHFTVKLAETLVRDCCCEVEPSWLESAVTMPQIKDIIVHIVLDLRWWKSMVDIAIASATGEMSEGEIEKKCLENAEKDFQRMLEEFKSPGNKLDEAFIEDREELLLCVREVLSSYSDKPRDHDYLLAAHVRTRLGNTNLVQSMREDVELNESDVTELINTGGYGAVMKAKWLGRDRALKFLNGTCLKEATSLSTFHHPHIVQFLRYWETTPSSNDPPHSVSPVGSNEPVPSDASSTDPENISHSRLLMERLPTDLAQHLSKPKPRVDSRRNSAASRSAPMSEDAGIDAMLQVSKAMSHLNDYDIAHRDLKPSNILLMPVSKDEFPELAKCGYVRAKLGDFGEVKMKARSLVNTTVSKVGTKMYAAPEIYFTSDEPESRRGLPRKADVWSFGIMFNEVLSGQPPFRLDESGRVILPVNTQNGSQPSLPASSPDFLKFIIPNCWQPRPQDRPSGRAESGVGENLHAMIQKGLRPSLPASCPDYLKFIITHCCQLRPQDRPSFTDLWKLLRIAHVRSLGLIRADYDFFTFTTREGSVRRLHELPAPLRVSSWLCLRIPSTRHEMAPGEQRQPNLNRQQSRPEPAVSRSEDKLLGYVVNLVPSENTEQDAPSDENTKRDQPSEKAKLDVIFFEGNVGRRKYLSCKDTWVQRGKPEVWWPEDWLAKDFSGDIRVLLLEYCISEKGIEEWVEELQELLVFSGNWNRGHTWNRPIVLVGHSLGCVVIEQLVVALNTRAELCGSLKDDFEAHRARVSKAFLASLAGCFFYAPPYTGLVPSEDLLKEVFGALDYSSSLFNGLTPPKLKELSDRFEEATSDGVSLMALTEKHHTRGRLVVPLASMDAFKARGGRVVELLDSNHSDTCKPIDKKHPAYRLLLEFIKEISAVKGVSLLESSAEGATSEHKLTRMTTFKRFLGGYRDD